jgi:hypothetical protein
LEQVRTFDKFTYDKECKFGSEGPANPDKTTRVLTIMRADEY